MTNPTPNQPADALREAIARLVEDYRQNYRVQGTNTLVARILTALHASGLLEKPITGETSDGYHTFNELYEHRCTLFLALLKAHPYLSWISTKHADDSTFGDWFIAGMNLPTGTVTYHLPARMWSLACETGAACLERAPAWDGHTSADVVKRLQAWLSAPAKVDEARADLMARITSFLEECEVAEDRSNLDGDSAEVVLQQINDGAEELLAIIRTKSPSAIPPSPSDQQSAGGNTEEHQKAPPDGAKETPETDAVEQIVLARASCADGLTDRQNYSVAVSEMSSFARTLELQRNALRREVSEAKARIAELEAK